MGHWALCFRFVACIGFGDKPVPLSCISFLSVFWASANLWGKDHPSKRRSLYISANSCLFVSFYSHDFGTVEKSARFLPRRYKNADTAMVLGDFAGEKNKEGAITASTRYSVLVEVGTKESGSRLLGETAFGWILC